MTQHSPATTPSHLQVHPELTLRDYWRALLGQRWLIVGITAAIVLVALVVTWMMTPNYRATSTLQIEREALNVVNVENLMPAESPQDRDFYETQYELLQSRSLARQVAREARLAEDPYFRELVEQAGAKFDASHPEAGKQSPQRQAAIERALVAALVEGLEIEPIRNSRLVRINFDSPDPRVAAKVANAYARVFIVSNQQRRLQASAFATKYLSERLQQLRDRVEDSERKLVAYSGEEMIVPVGEDKPSLPAQNLTELNALLAAAQSQRIKSETAWRQASHGDGMGLPQVVSSPLIQQLRTEQVRLNAEYQQKLSTFKPDYPEMMRLKAQATEVQQQINREVLNIRQALKAQYEADAQQEQLMNERIASLKGEEIDLQSRSIRYNLLKREADTNRQLYDALLQRYKEIGVAGNVGNNNISIVDGADVPGSPNSPKLPLNLALALVFGLFIGVAVALLRFLLRDPADDWART
ncbi:MAG TPA: GumC family protein [Stenotrophomonas sp.]|nr:GumC family protein [Stenotrophomonas sp.]